MLDPYNRRGRILSAALSLAASKSWSEVTLLDIARSADLPLTELRDEFATRTTSSRLCSGQSMTRSSSARPRRRPPRRSETCFSTSS